MAQSQIPVNQMELKLMSKSEKVYRLLKVCWYVFLLIVAGWVIKTKTGPDEISPGIPCAMLPHFCDKNVGNHGFRMHPF